MRSPLKAHFLHLVHAVNWSLAGLGVAWREEKAFQQIAICAFCAIITASFFAEDFTEFAILILPPCICVIVELLNTAIENAVNLTSPQWHILARNAKDTASAAQFCAQLLFLLIWAVWLCKKIFY